MTWMTWVRWVRWLPWVTWVAIDERIDMGYRGDESDRGVRADRATVKNGITHSLG